MTLAQSLTVGQSKLQRLFSANFYIYFIFVKSLAQIDSTTKLIMTLLITLNTGEIAYNDITYNINKCNIKYMFLLTVKSKVIYW